MYGDISIEFNSINNPQTTGNADWPVQSPAGFVKTLVERKTLGTFMILEDHTNQYTGNITIHKGDPYQPI